MIPELVAIPETFVSFRIIEENLDPDEITKKLALIPDDIHRKGERRRKPTAAPYRKGTWVLRSPLSKEKDLESQLEGLLRILEPRSSLLQDLSSHVEIDFYATIYNINGFQLSTQIINRIAKLGAGLGVTIYPGYDKVVEQKRSSLG